MGFVQRQPFLRLLDAVVMKFVINLPRAERSKEIVADFIRKLTGVNPNVRSTIHEYFFRPTVSRIVFSGFSGAYDGSALSLREFDIQQPVNHHPGDGNIQP